MKTYEKLVHIVGVKESTKFLLKDVCKKMNKTQVGWIEDHVNSDHQKLNEGGGKNEARTESESLL